jgi:hypothetical protein
MLDNLRRVGWLAPALCGLVVLISLDAAGAATPAEQELLRRVADAYRASRNAVTSVECEYDHYLNDTRWHVRYARDGDLLYHAGVLIYESGKGGMPREIAWNGQWLYRRSSFKTMSVSSDRKRAQPSCPLPEQWDYDYLGPALGHVKSREQRYTFLGAGAVVHDDHRCIELRFAADWVQGTLTSRHAEDAGLLPVYLRIDRGDGSLVYEMDQVRYARFGVGDDAVFHLVQASGSSGAPKHVTESRGNRMKLVVDESSLRVNQPVSPQRFVLAPWPCEEVTLWETQEVRPPMDPNWSPVGNVAFPWDVVAADFEADAKARAEAPVSDGASGGVTAKRRSRTGEIGYLNLPVISGLVILAGAGYWMYRRRRSMP